MPNAKHFGWAATETVSASSRRPANSARAREYACPKLRPFVRHNGRTVQPEIIGSAPSPKGGLISSWKSYCNEKYARKLEKWCPRPDLNRHGLTAKGF